MFEPLRATIECLITQFSYFLHRIRCIPGKSDETHLCKSMIEVVHKWIARLLVWDNCEEITCCSLHEYIYVCMYTYIPPLPNFTSPSSPPSLAVTGLWAPLSSSVLKRRYISLQNEWMNEWMNEHMCTGVYVCIYWDVIDILLNSYLWYTLFVQWLSLLNISEYALN